MADIGFDKWLNQSLGYTCCDKRYVHTFCRNNTDAAPAEATGKTHFQSASLETEGVEDLDGLSALLARLDGDSTSIDQGPSSMPEQGNPWDPVFNHDTAQSAFFPATYSTNDKVGPTASATSNGHQRIDASESAQEVTTSSDFTLYHNLCDGTQGGTAPPDASKHKSGRMAITRAIGKTVDAFANISVPRITKNRSGGSSASVSESVSTGSSNSNYAHSAWFADLRDWLASISRSRGSDKSSVQGECIFITPELSIKDRIRVRFTATCCGVSHLSIGKGPQKCMMLSPIVIKPSKSSRRSSGLAWGHIDPTVLCVHSHRGWAPSRELRARLPSHSLSRSAPVFLAQRWASGDAIHGASCFPMTFANAEDALVAGCEIAKLREPCAVVAYYVINPAIRGVSVMMDSRSHYSCYLKHSSGSTVESTTMPRPTAQKDNSPKPFLIAGASESSSPKSGVGSAHSSYHSLDSSESKKRRFERIEFGYVCQQCHRSFDRQCDRDKHWRSVHGERPHRCDYCQKSFAYNKDLRRHLQSVHNASLPDVSAFAGEES